MRLAVFAALALLVSSTVAGAESRCFGTTSNGRIEDSVKLPEKGVNYSAYSTIAAGAGRTHVHSTVADIIAASYAALASTEPDIAYVYGETGWASGGRFRPHRTHQNGLSVDFFVPVRNASGKSVPLPASMTNRFGYDIEFDANGKYGEYSIDFAALADHLYELHVAASARGSGLALVILDKPFLPKVFATFRGNFLKKHVPFMQGKPWVRHDEHYHVDFKMKCLPNSS